MTAPIPLSDMTEQQKNAYWAAQGVQLAPSAIGATKIGVGLNGIIIYDPASVAAGQAAAVALAQTDPVVVAALAALKQPVAPRVAPHVRPTERDDDDGN